jgi:hypothetical protein
LLHASFRPRLATTPLRFANPSPPSGWVKDFHLQAVDHARHTRHWPAFSSRPFLPSDCDVHSVASRHPTSYTPTATRTPHRKVTSGLMVGSRRRRASGRRSRAISRIGSLQRAREEKPRRSMSEWKRSRWTPQKPIPIGAAVYAGRFRSSSTLLRSRWKLSAGNYRVLTRPLKN